MSNHVSPPSLQRIQERFIRRRPRLELSTSSGPRQPGSTTATASDRRSSSNYYITWRALLFLLGLVGVYFYGVHEGEVATLSRLEHEEVNGNSGSLKKATTHAKDHCQIVYILGVEGVGHHGFEPILEKLAHKQVDPVSNSPYRLVTEDPQIKQNIQYALYGEQHWINAEKKIRQNYMGYVGKAPPFDDEVMIKRLLSEICPRNGEKHLIIEWHSFPTGLVNQTRPIRIKRLPAWDEMSSEEVANSETAQQHPLNLTAFYEIYSQYAEIKFIVLHRPYLQLIASHKDWFESIISHSQVTRGFLYIIRRFLDKYSVDASGDKIWYLVCMQHIFSKFYNNDQGKLDKARKRLIKDLATFLHWPVDECDDCFDEWRESNKDPEAILGDDVDVIREHSQSLGGIWPPTEGNQKCDI